MAKEKVYKLAQEFKVSSEALVQLLHQMGIPVKSHMSTVDENLRDDIKKRFDQERAEIKKEYERKKLMISKAKEELLAKSEPEKIELPKPKVIAAPQQTQQHSFCSTFIGIGHTIFGTKTAARLCAARV